MLEAEIIEPTLHYKNKINEIIDLKVLKNTTKYDLFRSKTNKCVISWEDKITYTCKCIKLSKNKKGHILE